MRRPARRDLARALTWPLAPVLLAGTLVVNPSAPAVSPADVPSLVALGACWAVGVVVTWRLPDQPAGWAFLGLGTAVAWSALCDEYVASGRGVGSTTYQLLATLSDSSFVWWFVFLALAVQLTPPGETRPAVTRRLTAATVVAGAVFQLMALLRTTRLDPPLENISSPLAIDVLAGITQLVAAVAIYGLGLCLVASAVVLVVAWRRSDGARRQQLLWLVAGTIPIAPCVVAAFALSRADENGVASVVLSGAMVALVTGAALSVLRYRLYEVERVVTDSAAYAIASMSVVVVFVAVLVVINRSTPIADGSQLPTVAATLAGVAVARVSWVWGRRAVGRRVNRALYDAVSVVRTGLSGSSADLDDLVAQVLGSGGRVLYPADGDAWVTSAGHAVTPGREMVDVRRHGAVIAHLEFDPAETERDVVEAVAGEAAAEMDNVALRAELARQLELIRESRTRLATAHLEERRRIERDLHDGAQQRLLAIALRLRSARLHGDDALLVAESDRAIAEVQVTVQELRDLAAGLQPAALAGGGLVAAVADLADRVPLDIHYDVEDERFPSALEGAAWFVIAETVTNAVKHSGSLDVLVSVRRQDDRLQVAVEDHGVGGADIASGGLRGLADRVGAVNGVLSVRDVEPHGTRVEAVFACAW
jgi:signal transduction histidine kinase